jgi:hypothetical protein
VYDRSHLLGRGVDIHLLACIPPLDPDSEYGSGAEPPHLSCAAQLNGISAAVSPVDELALGGAV